MNDAPIRIYKRLFKNLGPQRWWPADSAFEVIIGAILTQNTNWQNASGAVDNLKKSNLLSPQKLRHIRLKKLAYQIRPAGYYNIKAKRIKNFLNFFFSKYKGSLKHMSKVPLRKLRRELLQINGIGPETADSILLYALGKAAFVVDSYTRRIFSRHNFLKGTEPYQVIQDYFLKKLPKNIKLFNEFHALLVKLGKDYCSKSNPKCKICPLNISR